MLSGNTAFENFPHKEEFCYVIKITTPFIQNKDSLLPIIEELEDLENFEFFIENSLTQNQIENYHVFRDSHYGMRNFYIVTNNKVGATEVLQQIKNSRQQRAFDFVILIDKNWNAYNEFRNKVMNL